MNNIGLKIKRRRELMALTQAQLAKYSGVSQATISRLENHDYSISLIHFITLIDKLSIDTMDVLPNDSMTKITKVMDDLDHARKTKDIDKLSRILRRYPIKLWISCPELQIYKEWHEAIIDYHSGSPSKAINKIDRIIHNYEHVPACYEILAQVLNNYGNIQTNTREKVSSYKHAKELYLKSEQLNYQTYIDILVNLANTYCQMKKYKMSLRQVNEGYEILNKNNSTYHLTKLTLVECNAHFFQEEYDRCMEILLGTRTVFIRSKEMDLWHHFKNLFTTE